MSLSFKISSFLSSTDNTHANINSDALGHVNGSRVEGSPHIESMSESHTNKYRDVRGGLSISSTKSLSDDFMIVKSADIFSTRIKKEASKLIASFFIDL
jgi:hypothetical protein